MQEQEIELSVGDVLELGDHTVTVIDINGSEVSFRVDSHDTNELQFETTGQVFRSMK